MKYKGVLLSTDSKDLDLVFFFSLKTEEIALKFLCSAVRINSKIADSEVVMKAPDCLILSNAIFLSPSLWLDTPSAIT